MSGTESDFPSSNGIHETSAIHQLRYDDSSDNMTSSPEVVSDSPSGNLSQRLTFRADVYNLDEDDHPRSSKLPRKLSRNESEKLRRDRLNAYIGELAKMVPLILQSNKKMDKASILRLTVTYLRINHDLKKHSRGISKPTDFLTVENLGKLLLESINGFLLVVNQRGLLVFATEALTEHLGHNLVDVLGTSIYKLIHPEDVNLVRRELELREKDDKLDTDNRDSAHIPASGHRSFYLRMQSRLNHTSNQQPHKYELIHFVGYLKRMQTATHQKMDVETTLIGVGRLTLSEGPKELFPVVDLVANQWITRHDMDSRITYNDQRGSWITGFLSSESLGMPPYYLVHPEDISTMVTSHNIFLKEGTLPRTVFRMYTKSRDLLFISNTAHMVIDMWTCKPRCILSINEVIHSGDGMEQLNEVKRTIEELARNVGLETDTTLPCPSTKSACFIENIETHIENGIEVKVKVGSSTYVVDMGNFDPTSSHKNGHTSNIFDPYHTEDQKNNFPTVKPDFLGDPGEDMEQYVSADSTTDGDKLSIIDKCRKNGELQNGHLQSNSNIQKNGWPERNGAVSLALRRQQSRLRQLLDQPPQAPQSLTLNTQSHVMRPAPVEEKYSSGEVSSSHLPSGNASCSCHAPDSTLHTDSATQSLSNSPDITTCSNGSYSDEGRNSVSACLLPVKGRDSVSACLLPVKGRDSVSDGVSACLLPVKEEQKDCEVYGENRSSLAIELLGQACHKSSSSTMVTSPSLRTNSFIHRPNGSSCNGMDSKVQPLRQCSLPAYPSTPSWLDHRPSLISQHSIPNGHQSVNHCGWQQQYPNPHHSPVHPYKHSNGHLSCLRRDNHNLHDRRSMLAKGSTHNNSNHQNSDNHTYSTVDLSQLSGFSKPT